MNRDCQLFGRLNSSISFYFTTPRGINKPQQFVTRVTKMMGTPNDLKARITHKEYKYIKRREGIHERFTFS